MKKTCKKWYQPYLWLLPSVILMACVVFMPIVWTFRMAFSKITKSGVIKGFIGLKNFSSVLSNSTFYKVLGNTAIWVVAVVGISTILGLILALIMNKEFRGRKFARTVLLFPWATALVITAAIWKYILDYNYGSLNALLISLGLSKNGVNWLLTPASSFFWIIVIGIFVTVPFITFTLLSGLQSISNDYYEAASIDGASAWMKLTRITIPLLKPALNVSTVLNVIYVFNSFPIIWTITRGDPAYKTDNLVTYLYKMAFYTNKKGDAAAISVIGFVILLVFALIYMKTVMRGDDK